MFGDFGLGLRILYFGGPINCGQPDPYPVLGLKISDKPHLKIKLCFFFLFLSDGLIEFDLNFGQWLPEFKCACCPCAHVSTDPCCSE